MENLVENYLRSRTSSLSTALPGRQKISSLQAQVIRERWKTGRVPFTAVRRESSASTLGSLFTLPTSDGFLSQCSPSTTILANPPTHPHPPLPPPPPTSGPTPTPLRSLVHFVNQSPAAGWREKPTGWATRNGIACRNLGTRPKA